MYNYHFVANLTYLVMKYFEISCECAVMHTSMTTVFVFAVDYILNPFGKKLLDTEIGPRIVNKVNPIGRIL